MLKHYSIENAKHLTESTKQKKPIKPNSLLQASNKLIIDAIIEMTKIVESMHQKISPVPKVMGKNNLQRTQGLTGLVYSSVRNLTELVGKGIDLPLGVLSRAIKQDNVSPNMESLRSALNGVMGDHLVQRNNPLAITMTFRKNGMEVPSETLVDQINASNGKLVIMIHGLCMNDLQWQQMDHNHGTAINKELGHTDTYLHYNTGLHISENGKNLSQLLEDFVASARKLKLVFPLQISIIAHSMGGLVSRSAYYHAVSQGFDWPNHLDNLVCLGTPHHGAPLEKAGNWIDLLLGIHSYSLPLKKLTQIRSAGITDLRYGNILESDWSKNDRFDLSKDNRTPVALPHNVRCYSVATSTGKNSSKLMEKVVGDGLVPLESALGKHRNIAHTLTFDDQFVGKNINHLQLLGNRDVYNSIVNWLSK